MWSLAKKWWPAGVCLVLAFLAYLLFSLWLADRSNTERANHIVSERIIIQLATLANARRLELKNESGFELIEIELIVAVRLDNGEADAFKRYWGNWENKEIKSIDLSTAGKIEVVSVNGNATMIVRSASKEHKEHMIPVEIQIRCELNRNKKES